MRRIAYLAVLCIAAAAPKADAQTLTTPPPTRVAGRCTVIPDSDPAPTPQQVQERNDLHDQLQAVLRAHGQPERGLLLVDVDAERHGKLLFMEADLPDSTRHAVNAVVTTYLETLRAGRPYTALIRIDGAYPAMTPGRQHCRPELANADSLTAMMQGVLRLHPEAGQHAQPVTRRAAVRLVVTREGRVAYAEVDQPTGDAFIDPNLEAIAMRLRFNPATLDGDPFDVRFRFSMTFNVR
jgi:TonB family protein